MKKQNKHYTKLSQEVKMSIWQRLMGKIPHEFVGDFLIAEGIAFKVKSSPTVILHIPTGLWRGFSYPYDVALEMVKNDKSSHGDLLEAIYEA